MFIMAEKAFKFKAAVAVAVGAIVDFEGVVLRVIEQYLVVVMSE